MTFKILSCDGGGIRGLITALLIQDLEKDCQLISKADGFAGTSTGGLIALALANDVDIDAIITLYQHKGGTIFEPNTWFAENLNEEPANQHPAEMMALGIGPGIIWTQYKNDGLKKVAANWLGKASLKDKKKLVIVNSARLWNSTLSSWEACTISNASHNPYRAMLMKDAALATSAAPTYFPPFSVGDFGFFADGGVFANNPAVSAISESISSGKVKHLSDLRVLSLGTGAVPQGIPPSDIPYPLSWGATHWLWPTQYKSVPAMALLELTMDGTAQIANANASKILGHNNYCRGNYRLPEPFALDDYEHAGKLVKWTKKYMKTRAWARVKAWVAENWV